MSELCSKCGAQLSSPWRFCPLCGAVATPQVQRQQAPAETEKAPVKAAYSGLLFGVIVAPMCIIVGTMLCLTGLGAFLGVPMIIAGVLSPLLGPMIGIGEPKGKCPWCGTGISNVFNASGFECHACSKRIAVRDQRFIRAA
jgi:hypothetical protein